MGWVFFWFFTLFHVKIVSFSGNVIIFVEIIVLALKKIIRQTGIDNMILSF